MCLFKILTVGITNFSTVAPLVIISGPNIYGREFSPIKLPGTICIIYKSIVTPWIMAMSRREIFDASKQSITPLKSPCCHFTLFNTSNRMSVLLITKCSHF